MIALILAALILATLLGGGLRTAWRDLRNARRVLAEDQAIALTRHPAPGLAPASGPAPGHHRGNHMAVDCWECGCLWTWTRAAGWTHDFDCLDEEIRKLLTP